MKELLFKRKFRFILYLFACLIPVVSQLMNAGYMSLMFGAIERGNLDYYLLIVYIGIGYIFLELTFFISSRFLRINYMRDTILDVRIAAFEKILNTSYKSFSKKSKEVYISNLVNDINNFENTFFINLINFIFQIGLYLTSAIIVAFIDYYLAIALLLISFLNFLFFKLFDKKTTALQKQVSTESEEFTVDVANTFNGLEILKLNNIEKKFMNKSFDTINKVERTKFKFRFFADNQRSIANMIGFLTYIGVILYVLGQVSNQAIGYDQMMLIVMLSNNVSFALQNIFPRWNVIKSSSKIYDKITKLEDDHDQNNKPNNFAFDNKIEVKNLVFDYDGKQILENASCVIEKGKKYLIKGPSGVGKSTLIKLLSMTYDNYQGEILVDDTDLRSIKAKSFNNDVAFIYQDVFLFEDTIKNNIALFKDLGEDIIYDAIKKAGLSDFVEEKTNGVDELIHENGKNLSGGQRQRISIARAIAKEAKILFIDEGTSALNEELGRAVEQTFLNLDSTVISVSHRFYKDVTNHYDYVLELKNGKINTFTGEDYFREEAKYA